jgi:hypothetical protein
MPALRRPTPNLRFGIGLAYTGPKIAELRPDAASPDRLATTSGARPWTRVAGRFGEELQRALSEHVVRLRGEEPVTGPRRGRGQRRNVSARSTSLLDNATGAWLAPGVHFLAMGRESVLREAARREQVDVLVLVEWQDVDKNWSARITLIDPVRNASLLELPRINSLQISKARTDPLTDNPAATAFQKLTDFLEHQLSSQELPAQIEPRHVLGRLDALANGRSMSPLGALAEMRFYRERGLANDTQLLLAYQTLIGQKPGSALLLGDAAAREEVLSEWLPKPPLPATRAAALDDD